MALLPWLRTLDAERSLAGSLLSAWAMAVAYTAAVFAWFAVAIGSYTQLGSAAGLALLLLAAPLFQPQFLAFALLRHVVGRRHAALPSALVASAAWLACEWLLPRLLGDTLGYGLYPSPLLRQAAAVGGAAGLTLMLLLTNEALAWALARHTQAGLRASLRPLALAALPPLLLAAYGSYALSALAAPAPAAGPEGKPLRMGLVQSNIVDYERLRRERGAGAVVREVLDTHYAMSYDAVERQHVDAVLWSETVYPTTFGQPKSEAGAELDQEILDIVSAARVPFVFGTFDRDADGEYNAAAFVQPGAGLLGFYRKTRPFPLTEYVPAWLDGPALRRWLPWAGSWRPGSGARVFPLRLADGREIPVQPLICLDDVDTGLAIDGARLGARALLTLSNDAWFTEVPQGAALHQTVAAFRSIETGLPQFRVTSNGYSAVIDASGQIIAGSRMGERSLVIGALMPRDARTGLMLAWGDWVGRAASAGLLLLAAATALRRWWQADTRRPADEAALLMPLAVLPASARLAAGLLRSLARGSLLWLAWAIMAGDAQLQSNTLAQLRSVALLCLIPEAAAWCLLRAFAARVQVQAGQLVLTQGRRQLQLPLSEIAAAEPWRLPIPAAGAGLRLSDGSRWRYGLAGADAQALQRALKAGGAVLQPSPPSRLALLAQARLARRPGGRLNSPLAKFLLLPLLLALPAFRLHQHITYGSSFGEYFSLGLLHFLGSLALWWAAWAIAALLCAAVLRAAIEAATWAALWLNPKQLPAIRQALEGLGLAALYLGLPGWLLLRLLAS